MKKSILSIIVMFVGLLSINAQDVNLIKELANENDSILLVLDDYVGEIQWQSSQDSISWTDLEGEVSDSLLILVHENLYFQAVVTVGICDPFYSDLAYIENRWNQDNDSDGFTENQGDCNDSIPEINPGAIEAECCDGVDQNCDGYDCPVEFDKLDTVCGGNPVNCTAIYDSADIFHKIIFLDSEGFAEEWNTALASYYLPLEMDEVELIACISSSWNTIETCNYCVDFDCNYKLYRNRNVVEISIFVAATGEYLDSNTFNGGIPGECLPNESFEFYTKVKTGSKVIYSDVEEWLLGVIKTPIVITGEISEVTEFSALCFAEVTHHDSFPITERGICWSTSPSPTVADNNESAGSGIGPFNIALSNLNSLSRYYIRAYALTIDGEIIYGEVKSFTTLGVLTDTRDNTIYDVIQAGSQIWMAQNLAYLPEVCSVSGDCGYWVYDFEGESVSNAEATDNYKMYGVLYIYETAIEACPSGWHLPSDDEWKQLEVHLGMSQVEADDDGYRGTNEGGKLKETGTTHWEVFNRGATNEIGFCALPGGERWFNDTFHHIGSRGSWWTSSDFVYSNRSAWCREIINFESWVNRSSSHKTEGHSVRCVKD